MTEAEWLECKDPEAVLGYLRGRGGASDRKLRLSACAAARAVWPRLTDLRTRRAVEVAERYADGAATRRELQAAGTAAQASIAGFWEVSSRTGRFPRKAEAAARTARAAAYEEGWRAHGTSLRAYR
jgi:hypothetical protein